MMTVPRDSDLAVEWLKKNFEPNAPPSECGAIRLLIMDGHVSHLTFEFLDYCLSHDIICLCLPSHSTHILQPLDVGCFRSLQGAYEEELRQWNAAGHTGIDRGDFFPLMMNARDFAYRDEGKNILTAFESTGIHPFNPRAVNAPSDSRDITRGCGTKSPLHATPRNSMKAASAGRRALQLAKELAPQSQELQQLISNLSKAVGGAYAEKDLQTALVSQLRAQNKETSSKIKKGDKRVATKARVIDTIEAVELIESRIATDETKVQKLPTQRKLKKPIFETPLKTPAKVKHSKKVQIDEVVLVHEFGSAGEETDEDTEWEEENFVHIDEILGAPSSPSTGSDEESSDPPSPSPVPVTTRSGRTVKPIKKL